MPSQTVGGCGTIEESQGQSVPDFIRFWRVASEKGDNNRAKEIALSGLHDHPGELGLFRCLIQTYGRLGLHSDALEAAFAALAHNVQSAESQLLLSGLLLKNGFVSEAGRCAKAALRQAPNHVSALVRLSEVALRSGYALEAHRWADKAIESHPKSAGCFIARANIHFFSGEHDFARNALVEAERLGGPASVIQSRLKTLDVLREASVPEHRGNSHLRPLAQHR